jgi:pre-mRNA 3'-end-processing factor FIP1
VGLKFLPCYIPRTIKMDVDEDDDFYAPDDSGTNGMDEKSKAEEAAIPDVKAEQDDEDLEEGEEEGEAEGSDDSVGSRS